MKPMRGVYRLRRWGQRGAEGVLVQWQVQRDMGRDRDIRGMRLGSCYPRIVSLLGLKKVHSPV